MHLVVNLPNVMHVAAITQPWEHELGGSDIARVAREADALGFWGAMLPEHFLTPVSHLELSGDHYLHATTAQGFIAGATARLRVGSFVSILPLHHPVITAKALATLDWCSGGRAWATFGVGWLKEEFDVLGVPFERRGRLADEYLAAILCLLHDERPSFEGEYVRFDDVAVGPMPISRPHPPIWLGGDADAVVRRAARFADGWAPWLTTPEELPAKLDALRSHPDWDDRPFSLFYSLAALGIGAGHAVVDDPAAAASWNAEEVVDSCGRLAALGVTHTWVAPPPVSGLEQYLDHLRWVDAEVAPAVAGL